MVLATAGDGAYRAGGCGRVCRLRSIIATATTTAAAAPGVVGIPSGTPRRHLLVENSAEIAAATMLRRRSCSSIAGASTVVATGGATATAAWNREDAALDTVLLLLSYLLCLGVARVARAGSRRHRVRRCWCLATTRRSGPIYIARCIPTDPTCWLSVC